MSLFWWHALYRSITSTSSSPTISLKRTSEAVEEIDRMINIIYLDLFSFELILIEQTDPVDLGQCAGTVFAQSISTSSDSWCTYGPHSHYLMSIMCAVFMATVFSRRPSQVGYFFLLEFVSVSTCVPVSWRLSTVVPFSYWQWVHTQIHLCLRPFLNPGSSAGSFSCWDP